MTHGVKNMSVDRRVSDKIKQQFSVIIGNESICMVEQEETSLLVRVEEHEPLDLVRVNYICRSHVWSKNYNPVYECRVEGNRIKRQSDFCIAYRYCHKSSLFVAEDGEHEMAVRLCERMNHNTLLLQRIRRTDLNCLSIQKKKHDYIELKISPFSGMITRILIPPATSYVRPHEGEIVQIFQILQLMITDIKILNG